MTDARTRPATSSVERALGAVEQVPTAASSHRRREQPRANLRWAGNTLTTNGVTRGRALTVIATVDGAEGTAAGVVSRAAVTRRASSSRLVAAAEQAARGRRAGRGRPAAGRRAMPTPARLGRRPPTSPSIAVFGALRPGARRGRSRAARGGRPRAVRLRRARASPRPTSARRPGCGCGTTSRPAAWSSTASRRTGSARLGRRGHPRLHRRRRRRRSTPSWPSASAGRSAGSTCPPGRYETLLPPAAVRRPDGLPLLVGRRPATPPRAARSSASPAAAPASARRSPTLPLTLCSDPRRAGPGVRAVRRGARLRPSDARCSTTACRSRRTDWIARRRAGARCCRPGTRPS